MLFPQHKEKYTDVILANYLDEIYFDEWRKDNKSLTIEIMINAKCNLNCKYCYYTAFGDVLVPSTIDETNIPMNVDNLLGYLHKNQIYPNINIFSGEPFEQDISFIIIDKILDFYAKNPKHDNSLVVPTNFSFISSPEKTKTIRGLINKAKANGNIIILSASFDGKFCDSNRPFKSGFVRDDDWYEDAFAFCKEYGFGFHPMIYFDHIEKWKDNFLWFQDMMIKHDITDKNLFLLEVRNDGWDKTTINHAYKFYEFITEYILKNNETKSIKEIIDNDLHFNVFSIFMSSGKALSCSYETALAIRASDLKIYPCHRLQYPQFEAGQLYIEDDKIQVESKNIEMFIASNHISSKKHPTCEKCDINELCFGGCLGSQFEIMKDPFISIPSVCAFSHIKLKAVLDVIQRYGRDGELLELLDRKCKLQAKTILNKEN